MQSNFRIKLKRGMSLQASIFRLICWMYSSFVTPRQSFLCEPLFASLLLYYNNKVRECNTKFSQFLMMCGNAALSIQRPRTRMG